MDSDEDPCLSPKEEDAGKIDNKEVVVLIAGKSGAGKSSLSANLFVKNKTFVLPTAASNNKECVSVISRFGLNIKVIETPCKEAVKVKESPDVLVYCVSVSPDMKFADGNPVIMETIQHKYSNKVWEHCVVAFTFSNFVLKRHIEIYRRYIEDSMAEFGDYLTKVLKVKRVNTKTIFNKSISDKADEDMILGIPAGDMPDDKVIPGTSLSWINELFLEMIHKCKERRKLQLYYDATHLRSQVFRANSVKMRHQEVDGASDEEVSLYESYASTLPVEAVAYLTKELDWDHEGVDKHLNAIADVMIDWDDKYSTLLELTRVEIHDLKQIHLPNFPKLLRRGALMKWKAKKAYNATYGNLMKLCSDGQDINAVEIICRLLREKAQEYNQGDKS